eukprot:6468479-Amphidinium_carterae.2
MSGCSPTLTIDNCAETQGSKGVHDAFVGDWKVTLDVWAEQKRFEECMALCLEEGRWSEA